MTWDCENESYDLSVVGWGSAPARHAPGSWTSNPYNLHIILALAVVQYCRHHSFTILRVEHKRRPAQFEMVNMITASQLETALRDIRALNPTFIPSLAASGCASQFAGVCLHKLTRRYHAQHKAKTVGTGASDLEAAILCARSRGTPVATLLKRTDAQIVAKIDQEVPGLIGRKRGPSQFTCTIYHAGNRRWVAHYNGTYCGNGATDVAAAITVSERYGVSLRVLLNEELREKYMPVGDLRCLPPSAAAHGSPRKRKRTGQHHIVQALQRSTSSSSSSRIHTARISEASSEDSDRFQALTNVYHDWLPAGLERSIQIRKDRPDLRLEAPLLQMACILEQEPRFQDTVVSLWLSDQFGCCNSVRHQHAILIEAAMRHAQDGADRTALNLTDAGLGWLSTFQFWEMIEKDPSGDFRVAGTSYAVRGWSSKLQARLQLVQDTAVALNSIEVPRTLLQWQAVYQTVSNLDLASAASQNVIPWLIRTWMIVEMRARGVKRLAATKPMTIDAFAAMFPDQCKWVHTFGAGHAAIQDVWAAQRYESPPELYGMHTCFAGHPVAQRYKAAWIRECELPLK